MLCKDYFFSRDGEIRTRDLFVPNEARYRAALHPVRFLRNAKLLKVFNGNTIFCKLSI